MLSTIYILINKNLKMGMPELWKFTSSSYKLATFYNTFWRRLLKTHQSVSNIHKTFNHRYVTTLYMVRWFANPETLKISYNTLIDNTFLASLGLLFLKGIIHYTLYNIQGATIDSFIKQRILIKNIQISLITSNVYNK